MSLVSKFFIIILFMEASSSAYDCKIDYMKHIDEASLIKSVEFSIHIIPNNCDTHVSCLEYYSIFKKDSTFKTAIPKIKKLADNGNEYAQLYMGLWFFLRDNRSKYYDISEKFWKRSANKHLPNAHYSLAILYLLQERTLEAKKNLEIASDLGHPEAMFMMSLYYYFRNNDNKNDANMFFILSMQAMLNNSSLLLNTQLNWPQPCNNEQSANIAVTHILNLIIGNEGWYSNDLLQKQIAKILIGYDQKYYEGSSHNYYSVNKKHGIPSISTSSLLRSTLSFKTIFGEQEFIDKLTNQPNRTIGPSLKDLFDELSSNNKYLLYSKQRTSNVDNTSKYIKELPDKKLWNILAPNDLLLLSDKITHHYINVFKVDRDNKLIYLIDHWPEESFLLTDMNESNIKGRIIEWKHGKKFLVITMDELFKVLLGAIVIRPEPELAK